jgi:hypothetical protein
MASAPALTDAVRSGDHPGVLWLESGLAHRRSEPEVDVHGTGGSS